MLNFKLLITIWEGLKMNYYQTYTTLLLSCATALLLTACEEKKVDKEVFKNATPTIIQDKVNLSGLISFNVKGAKSLITTQESASSAQLKHLSSTQSTLPTLTFYNSKHLHAEDDNLSTTEVPTDVTSNDTNQDISDENSTQEVSKLSNLFNIDANGIASPAISSSQYDLKVQYTLLSHDARFIYIALNPGFDYRGEFTRDQDTEDTRRLIAQNNCAIYKVSLEDDSYSCLDEGYLAFPISEEFRKVLSDANSKPLQLDSEGNLYYLTAPFNRQEHCHKEMDESQNQDIEICESSFEYNWDNNKVLRKVTPEGIASDITPDNNHITNFKVTEDGAIIYLFNDQNGAGGLNLYHNGATNALTNSAQHWYNNIFFTTDDIGTVIFGSSDQGWGDQGIQFAQKHPVVSDGKISKTLNTSLFTTRNNSPTPNRIMLGDDGAIYGLFTEDTGYWDNGKQIHVNRYVLNTFRILPYRQSPIASIELETNDWWSVMNGLDFQIAKGYIYYVENEKHPTSLYADRQVIKIVKMLDGSTVSLLNKTQEVQGYLTWPERYDIFSWKLIGDIIYFSGFDNSNSTVVTGEIDTLLVKQGSQESEYLHITQAASALGAAATIKDMEILKPRAPEVDTGGAPVVTHFYTDPENLYSASIDFSKYMNTTDIDQKTRVTTSVKDESGETVEENINTMNVWLNKTLHLIMDTNISNAETDPLKNSTQYNISIEQNGLDRWGWEMIANDISFTTIQSEGWYQTTSERVEGITDGIVARYVNKESSGEQWNYFALLTDQLDTPNAQVEFSFKMKGDNQNRISLILKDAKRVDWDKVWSGTNEELIFEKTDNTRIWERVEGHFENKDNTLWYFDRWEDNAQFLDVYYERNLSNRITRYEWVNEVRVDISGNQYQHYWASSGEYIKQFSSTSEYLNTFYKQEGYYVSQDGNSTFKFITGQYRNVNNHDEIIDFEAGIHYEWIQESFVDENGISAVDDFWSLEVLPSGYDDISTPVKERIILTKLHNADDTLTEDNEIKWNNEYYRLTNDHNETEDEFNWNDWETSVALQPEHFTDNDTNHDARLVQMSFESHQNINYEYSTHENGNMQHGNKQINFDYRNTWYKGIFKFLEGTFTFDLINDQGESINIVNSEGINTVLQNSSGKYRIDLKLEDSRDIMMDNVKVSALNSDGSLIEPALLDETFSDDISNSPVLTTQEYKN
jgi:hypothetical protein